MSTREADPIGDARTRCKVLLVDDEEDFAQTLASRLRERGFQVDVALSGEEAIEKLDGAEATTEDKPELS